MFRAAFPARNLLLGLRVGARFTTIDSETNSRDWLLRDSRETRLRTDAAVLASVAQTYVDDSRFGAHAGIVEGSVRRTLAKNLPHVVRPAFGFIRGTMQVQHLPITSPSEIAGCAEPAASWSASERHMWEIVFAAESRLTPVSDLRRRVVREVVLPLLRARWSAPATLSGHTATAVASAANTSAIGTEKQHAHRQPPLLSVTVPELLTATGWLRFSHILRNVSLQQALILSGRAVAVAPGVVVSAEPAEWVAYANAMLRRAGAAAAPTKVAVADMLGVAPGALMQPSFEKTIARRSSAFRLDLEDLGFDFSDDMMFMQRATSDDKRSSSREKPTEQRAAPPRREHAVAVQDLIDL